MNRSFHAFAVLLVSLAGGMIAATWTTMLPDNRQTLRFQVEIPAPSAPIYCSCNPDDRDRFEKGCARDKTTGELYGCGLGLGKNGVIGKSVLGVAADRVTGFVIEAAKSLHQGIVTLPWNEVAGQASQWQQTLVLSYELLPAHPSHELDYAAAELAAAGFDAHQADSSSLKVGEQIAPLYKSLSEEAVSQATNSVLSLIERTNNQWERESRLWLVERGLHRFWDDAAEAAMKDDATEAAMKEEQLAASRMLIDDESFDRWFENFPPPITQPNRLINPIEPKDDAEESRRIILATAKALEALSGLLHQTAENLARHAEQDVAELNKLKSGLEERR